MKVSVLGSGSWGTALAVLLAEKGYDVKMWARDINEVTKMTEDRENKRYLEGVMFPKTLAVTNEPEESIKGAEVVVFAVPSQTARSVSSAFSKYLKSDQIIVNVSKGIEEDSLLRLSEVFKETVPQCSFTTLSGPSHAEEVGRFMPTTVVVAGNDKHHTEFVQEVFNSNRFRVYSNLDLIGVELGGALKNVIALACGMSDGYGFGDNTKSALMTRGSVEIARLGVSMGAASKTFSGLSGIGDLIVTCTSVHSRNRRAGILLGQGKTLQETLLEVRMVVEGIKTAKAANILAGKQGVEMPITHAINEVLFNDKSVEAALTDLMSRTLISEHESEDI